MLSSLILIAGITLCLGGGVVAYKGVTSTTPKPVNGPWLHVFTIKDLEEALFCYGGDRLLKSQFSFPGASKHWSWITYRPEDKGILFTVGAVETTVSDLSEALSLIPNKSWKISIGCIAGLTNINHTVVGMRIRLNRTAEKEPFVELDPNSNYAFYAASKTTNKG